MHTITISSGRRFEAHDGETVLDAALRQGIVLDHSCKTGRCSSCRATVRAGSTEALAPENGLSLEERAQGVVLTCVRKVCSESLELDVNDLGDVVLPEVRTMPCRIHALEKLSVDVVRVVLRLPPATPLSFLPGQYIDVIGNGGLRRSYSIANAPRSDHLLELHIRSVPDGAMSEYWFKHAKVNDLLRLRGPLGTFFLREQVGKHLVLLATGTGIAPVKAILEDLALRSDEARPLTTTVFWGGRQASDLYWQPPDQPGFRFVPVLSRATEDWHGARGHVQDVFLTERPDLARTLVYACGSDVMIDSARERLSAAGLADHHFHSDAFVCSATT